MIELVNKVFKKHFGPVPHDYMREKKVEELASEIVADKERIDEERAGRRASHEIEDWSGLSKKGRRIDMKESLYELSTELATIKEIIADNEGVLDDILEKRLDDISLKLTDKAAGISRWLLNIDGNIEVIESEINRLKKRKEFNDHLKDRLKAYLKDSMEKAGMDKIDTGIMVLAIQRNPPSVAILDEKEIPVEYEILTIVKTIDKKHLLEDLKAGKAISGAELRQGTHLRLK